MLEKFWLAVIASLAIIAAGCATTQSDIEGAEAFCENNGGVAKINPKYSSTVKPTCNNGAMFTFKGIK